MSDEKLAARLREHADWLIEEYIDHYLAHDDAQEIRRAADRLDAAEAENERLRAALAQYGIVDRHEDAT